MDTESLTAPSVNRCGEFRAYDKAVEEAVPFDRRSARIGKHLPQLVNAIVGQGGNCLVRAIVDADNDAVGEVVVVADERSVKFPQCLAIRKEGKALPSFAFAIRSSRHKVAGGTPVSDCHS